MPWTTARARAATIMALLQPRRLDTIMDKSYPMITDDGAQLYQLDGMLNRINEHSRSLPRQVVAIDPTCLPRVCTRFLAPSSMITSVLSFLLLSPHSSNNIILFD